jgi:hypothetical protein
MRYQRMVNARLLPGLPETGPQARASKRRAPRRWSRSPPLPSDGSASRPHLPRSSRSDTGDVACSACLTHQRECGRAQTPKFLAYDHKTACRGHGSGKRPAICVGRRPRFSVWWVGQIGHSLSIHRKPKLARRWFRHDVPQFYCILCLSGMRRLLQRCPRALPQCRAKGFLV